MTKGRYLEVIYRKGKPLAAYLYLPRRDGDTAARSEPFAPPPATASSSTSPPTAGPSASRCCPRPP